MIFYVFLCQGLGFNITKIQKTIYLIEGEEYNVYLDYIFKDGKDYQYSFQSNNKGFTLDNSSLKLKSSQGVYSKLPTKIMRQRQLINLEDYQGLGQFGILDQHDSGHRICYNNDDQIINLDQCIELDNDANNYDFVFIDRNTIAVSMVRVADQQLGVIIYQDQKLMNELYFNPSKNYKQVKKTIIEYCIFESNKYLLVGVTDEDSNIEFLEIQYNFQIVNTNKVIDKSLLSQNQVLQVYDIKGTIQLPLITKINYFVYIYFEMHSLVKDFRGFDLGYSFTQKYLNQTVSEESQQIANIYFQVLSKDDYNLYELQDLTQDLYYNLGYQPTKHQIPQNGISGPAIQLDLKDDGSVQFRANYLVEQELYYGALNGSHAIQEYLITVPYSFSYLYYNKDFHLFRQLDDFTFSIKHCYLKDNIQYCDSTKCYYKFQNQKITFQNDQLEGKIYALLEADSLQIHISYINKKIETTDDKFVDFKLGTDRLFIYTEKYFIKVYKFPLGKAINILDLSQFGQSQGQIIKKLWINQAKTNLIVITFGEDLIIGRFTIQYIFIQRITIKWVIDVCIIADNKFIVQSTDKTNKKLTQYIIEEGKVRIQRELSTYGYIISGDNILCDYIKGQIIIQAQKDSQKALLVFGDTELTRDSLLKIIFLSDDEIAVNIIYINQQSCLFKRSKDENKNSSLILGINSNYKEFEINLTQIPNKFSEQLYIEYVFTNEFSQNIIKKEKNLHIQHQFQNIIVRQPNQIINYKNEDYMKIPINPDTFQGLVGTLKLEVNKDTKIFNSSIFSFTTRFKNKNCFFYKDDIIFCQQVVKFERILCIEKQSVTFYNLNMETISQLRANIWQKENKRYLWKIILRNDESFALIRTTDNELIFIAISQNQIKLSHKQYWINSLNISLFYKDWLAVCDNNQIRFFKFQSYANELFLTQQYNQIVINKIQAIQYDPITQQIFYQTGEQKFVLFQMFLRRGYYKQITGILIQFTLNIITFKDLLEGSTNIIFSNYQLTKKLISTSFDILWQYLEYYNPQDFQINNMYIFNGPYKEVYDIQLIDNYMLVLHFDSQLRLEHYYERFQSLYKNTNDWQLNKPYLPLELIIPIRIIGQFKINSQIVLIHPDYGGICQSIIDDEIYIIIKDLKLFPFGNLKVIAENGFGQAEVNYQIIKETQNIWVIVIIIFVGVIVVFLFKKSQNKNNKKKSDNKCKDIELQ